MDEQSALLTTETPGNVNTNSVVVNVQKNNTYYDKRNKKIGDFFLGLIGIPIISSLVGFIFNFIIGLIITALIRGNNYYSGATLMYSISSLIILVLNIGVIIYLFKIKRHYVALGMISSVVVIPLILFGSCMLLMGGFSLFWK